MATDDLDVDRKLASDPPLFEFFEMAPRLNRLLDGHYQTLVPPITFGQYRTLRRIDEGYDTLTAITSVATLSMPAISERIEVLVRKGLLRRRVNRRDRRSATLLLTPDGLRVLDEGYDLMHEVSAELLRELDAKAQREFVASIRAIAQAVSTRLR